MYTAPPPKDLNEEPIDLESAKDIVTDMAQRLYAHFSQMNLNADQWLKCLENFLAEEEGQGQNITCPADVDAKIATILQNDKHIPLNQISEDAKKAVYREVAEWLAAEKICEKMIKYERSIEDGLKSGRLMRFKTIKEVNVLKDDGDAFGAASSVEEMTDFLQENYVVDMLGPIVGAGARVEVRELKPVKFPLPYPENDELREGLMIKIPNRFLVVRLTKKSYRNVLGDAVAESEKNAIKAFVLASELLFFPGKENSVEGVSACVRADVSGVTEEEPENESLNGPLSPAEKHSFIPPLLIIQAQIGDSGPMEYMTIQKKVMAQGSVLRNDWEMKRDLKVIPGFKEKVRLFVAACKNFHEATGLLPDLVGNGNVLYTKRGNIYLVDINNITGQPDYRLIALIGLAKDLQGKMESDRIEEEKKVRYRKEFLEIRKEILEEMEGKPQYEEFCNDAAIDRILDTLYMEKNDFVRVGFLRAVRLIDNLKIPIFLHNISNLMGIEIDVLQSELDKGEISEEEFQRGKEALNDDPLYKPLRSAVGVWKNKRCYVFEDILDNKEQGHNNWIADYVSKIYGNINSDGLGL